MEVTANMPKPVVGAAPALPSVLDRYFAAAEEKRLVDEKLSTLRPALVSEGLQQIAECIERYQLTAEDLKEVMPPQSPSNSFQKVGSTTRRSYRDPTTGRIWNGHGKRPSWLLEHGPDACLIT